ncbi:hypothetical protein ACFV2U_54225 [Streptomyces sp. NPDC059697]|uniref:hypothetical protein n=1 Tax=Streptomyces sp. NPDC059697 TaxID=3346912 RepID=UPI0036B824BF
MTWSLSGNYLAGCSCAMVCGCAVDAELQDPQGREDGLAARPPDMTVTGPAAAWPYFTMEPTASRAAALGFVLTGPARARFLRLLRAFPRTVGQDT